MHSEQKPFLSAHWKYLAMLNYEVDPAILEPLVPPGTELDSFAGKTFVSMVGFLFLRTRVRGVPVPWHSNFEEVNLRFYVRRRAASEDDNGGWRRGVVFIKEIVPRFAIAYIARKMYGENYVAMPMRHAIDMNPDGRPARVRYEWQFQGRWSWLQVLPDGEAAPLQPGSEEEFITEHYWGYTDHGDGTAGEYRVTHPSWNVWQVRDSELHCDVAGLYGAQFAEPLQGQPSSAFLAEGSPIQVLKGTRLS